MSHAGFRGSRLGEPYDAGIIRDAGAPARRACRTLDECPLLADRGRRTGAETQVKSAAASSATGFRDDYGEPEQIADFVDRMSGLRVVQDGKVATFPATAAK